MKFIEHTERRRVQFELNGVVEAGDAEPRMLLSDFLRQVIGARGTHVGCEHGVCGACTVKIDGELARACLVFAVQVEGGRVETVEGLGANAQLGPLQRAFRRNHALQCGYCTPGILISLSDLLTHEPAPSEDRVREVLSGHLCRCTGYTAIIRAALEAARVMRDGDGLEGNLSV